MRMPLPAVLAALVLGALCAVAVACGGGTSQLLSERRADRLTGDIDRVGQAVDAGDCEATAVRLEELQAELADLPASVSPRLRERLTEGVARLAQQATEECQGERTETLETQEQPAPAPETPETPTTETPTEPETPPATDTEPEQPEEDPADPPAETPTGQTPAPDPETPADPGTGGGTEGDAGTGGVGEGGATP